MKEIGLLFESMPEEDRERRTWLESPNELPLVWSKNMFSLNGPDFNFVIEETVGVCFDISKLAWTWEGCGIYLGMLL